MTASKPIGAALRTILRALQPFGPVPTQAFGQIVSLVTQAAMLKIFGRDIYGSVGLGLVTATTLAFVGELGYPPLLLREAAVGDWRELWAVAALQRLLMLALAGVGATVAWLAVFGADAPGSIFMIAALPGLILSAFNPVPVLYGMGRVRTAAAVTYLRWIVYGIALVPVLAAGNGNEAGLGVGLAFTLGIASQAIVIPLLGHGIRVWLPKPRLHAGTHTTGALAMWSMSLAGAVNDRFLPFLIKATRPDLLAHALLIAQVLQGLGGLAGQLDRLLVPWLSSIRHSPTWRRELLLIQNVTFSASMLAIATLSLAAIAFVMRGLVSLHEVGMLTLLLIEWGITIAGLTFTAAILATRNERSYAVGLVALLAASVLLQVAVASFTESFLLTMLLRIATVLAAVAIPMRLVHAPLPSGSLVGLAVISIFGAAMMLGPSLPLLVGMAAATTLVGGIQAYRAGRRILAG